MRVLLVHPGATVSTHDVAVGLRQGLMARGHELWDYALDERIARSGQWLHWCWKRGKKANPDAQKATPADVLYHAGEELVARALRVMPDIILVVSAMYLHPDVFVLLRRAGLKVTVLFTESPYDDERQWRLLSYVHLGWTNERTSVRDGVHYIQHAWNIGTHGSREDDDSAPAHDVVFVGTGFEERCELLSAVDWDGIDFGLYGSWELLGKRNKLRRRLCGGNLPNDRTALLYRRAAIGLNLHRQSKGFGKNAPRITTAESLNPRAFELAASGCFTLSDARAEVGEVFGDLVPTFSSPTELRALIDRWLADTAGRARVRAQLPGAVAAHTWHARAAVIERDIIAAGLWTPPAAPALPPVPSVPEGVEVLAGG